MKSLTHLISFFFLLNISSIAIAAIPPPPVNQNLGIPDTSFSNYDQTLCQSCHWASARGVDPINNAPVKQGYNPNRHHLAVNTEIDGNPEFPPNRDANDDGVNDTYFSCLSCHKINWGSTDIAYATLMDIIVPNYRNCLGCHERDAGSLTVHHATELAQTGFCFKCHGGLVRGIDVHTLEGKKPDPNNVNGTIPVRIPTYSPSMITPWRSSKPLGDDNPEKLSIAGIEPGNCNYCHNVDSSAESGVINGDANGDPDAFGGGVPQIVTLPNGEQFTVPILTNAQNHHNTGFYQDNKCAWCHHIDGEYQTSGQAIRVCQRCHDRATLHNIEFDAVGDGITPGAEEPYYGHIGSNDNCWGCHGFSKEKALNGTGINNQGVIVTDEESARNSINTSLIPTIKTLSVQSVSTGMEMPITITGQSMVNSRLVRRLVKDENGELTYDKNNRLVYEDSVITWASDVVITDKNNNSTVIEADYQNSKNLEFILPATLSAGFYQISLKKGGGQVSNPIGLTVTPSISVKQGFVFTPYGGMVVLFGNNFMETVAGFNYKIVDQNGQPPIAVYLWRDDLIIAKFQNIPESVTIEHIFDEKIIPLDKY